MLTSFCKQLSEKKKTVFTSTMGILLATMVLVLLATIGATVLVHAPVAHSLRRRRQINAESALSQAAK